MAQLTERREGGKEEVIWMTDILPQWLTVPETMSNWPEVLGSVCSFWKGAVCAVVHTEPKARGSQMRLVHMMWAERQQKVATGIQRQPRMQNPLQRNSLILPEIAASKPKRLCSPCLAKQGLWH